LFNFFIAVFLVHAFGKMAGSGYFHRPEPGEESTESLQFVQWPTFPYPYDGKFQKRLPVNNNYFVFKGFHVI